MLSTRFTHLLAAGALALSAASCADPNGLYDDFKERYQAAHPPIDAGPGCGHDPCDPPDPMGLEGKFLMTLSAKQGPDTPILLIADVTTPASGSGVAVAMKLQALDAMDMKTPVGNPISIGPYDLTQAGQFQGDLPDIVIPGASNPISGSDVTTSKADGIVASLCGHVCKDEPDFICGDINGKVKAGPLPLTLGDASGSSHYTLQRIPASGGNPAPLKDCDKTPIGM